MTDGSRDGERPRGPPPRRDDRDEPAPGTDPDAGTGSGAATDPNADTDADTSPGTGPDRPAGSGPAPGAGGTSGPDPDSGFGPDDPDGPVAWLRWLANTDHGGVVFVRETLLSVGAVLLVGLLLFAVSGIWPPMVAVESTSMQPHLGVGDLVFVMEEGRFPPAAAHGDTGVVTAEHGAAVGYRKFGAPGDVVVYRPDGRVRSTPIIHRAMFWVDDGENWYGRADPDDVAGYSGCDALPNCPAPHAGFVTKGDNEATNGAYDQVNGLSTPVRPEWIVGTAELRVPLLGYVKLCASGGPCPMTVVAADPGPPPAAADAAPGSDHEPVPELATVAPRSPAPGLAA